MAKTDLSIDYTAGMICEEVSFTEAGEQFYTVGTTIPISDSLLQRARNIIITNISIENDGENGKQTVVRGYTEEYAYTRKSPAVSMLFMTLTRDEYSEFTQGVSLNKLEYIPYIKIGKEFGINGWTLYTVVEKLAVFMGLEIEINVPNFDIKSFSIAPSETFFESLTGLVGAFEPIITLVGNILYILDRNGAGQWGGIGALSVGDQTSRTRVQEHNPQPGCLKIEGQEGEYITGKDPTKTRSYISERTVSFTGERILEDGSHEEYAVVEIWYVDQYDTNWALKSNETILITVSSDSEILPTYAKIITEFTYFDGEPIAWGYGHIPSAYRSPNTLSAEYENPVEYSTKVLTYTKWVEYNENDEPVFSAGDLWVLLTEKVTTYDYADDWLLRGQTTAEKGLWADIGGSEGWEVYDASKHLIAECYDWTGTLITNCGKIASICLDTQELKSITKNSYSSIWTKITYRWDIDTGTWKNDVETTYEIVQAGGAQQNKPSKRTMEVWAGDCRVFAATLLPLDDRVMAEPAKIISIPTPDWDCVSEAFVYLRDLIEAKFISVNIEGIQLDPIPYIELVGTGVTGILGGLYLTGYAININGDSGYTCSLNCEGKVA